MELALVDAQLAAGATSRHINAHGTSTPLNDLAEARAINKVFGEPGPSVTSTKGVTGHGLGAAGAIEAVASVLDHRPPPASRPPYGCEQLDPEIHLDVVQGEARAWEPGPVLSNSFGFGGHNGCLIIRAPRRLTRPGASSGLTQLRSSQLVLQDCPRLFRGALC